MSVTFTVTSCLRRLVSVVARPFERHHLERKIRELKERRRQVRERRDEHLRKQEAASYFICDEVAWQMGEEIEELEERLARW